MMIPTPLRAARFQLGRVSSIRDLTISAYRALHAAKRTPDDSLEIILSSLIRPTASSATTSLSGGTGVPVSFSIVKKGFQYSLLIEKGEGPAARSGLRERH